MNKIIKILALISLIIVVNTVILINTVKAVETKENTIYSKEIFERVIKYKGMLVKTANAVYESNGVEYPAYCLNVELKGVGNEIPTYQVTNLGKIDDVKLWRIMINGYPYKSLEELGVESIGEAYTATKQAIYCYTAGNDPMEYTGINESGERVANAIRKIVADAGNTQEEIGEKLIKIEALDEQWKKEGDYIVKQYKITTNINISGYEIKLEGIRTDTKITDTENNLTDKFNSNEVFKISIPTENLEESGEFKIQVITQMETKPIFFGQAPSSDLQNYALTAYSYEDVDEVFIEKYNYEKPKPPEEPPKEKPPAPILEIPKLPVTGK